MTRTKVRTFFVVVMGNTELKYPMYSDIYGISKTITTPTKDGSTTNGTQPAAKKTKTKSVIHLSLRDSLPAYGPIASMTFSLAKNGVSPCSITLVVVPLLTNRLISFQDRPVPELVAATGSGISGGFTLFQVLFHSLSLFSVVLTHGTCTSAIFRSLQKGNSISSVALVGYGPYLYVNL